MAEKIAVDDMFIEVTRRCNMSCPHCMRGDMQSIDISLKFVETLFQKIEYIGILSITGGEPSLVPEIILGIIKLAEKYDVDIGGFWLVTNGKKISDAFLQSVIRLYGYCSDNEISGLALSIDEWHETCPPENKKILQLFSCYKEHGPREVSHLLAEGRGIDCGAFNENRCRTLEVEDNRVTELYLNCKGNIINGCDWSYESQEDPDNIVCHVNDLSLDAMMNYQGALLVT